MIHNHKTRVMYFIILILYCFCIQITNYMYKIIVMFVQNKNSSKVYQYIETNLVQSIWKIKRKTLYKILNCSFINTALHKEHIILHDKLYILNYPEHDAGIYVEFTLKFNFLNNVYYLYKILDNILNFIMYHVFLLIHNEFANFYSTYKF